MTDESKAGRTYNPFDQEGWVFLRVHAGKKLLWLCVVDDEIRTSVYIPDSGRFHLNKGLYEDYIWDNKLTYVYIGVEEARKLIEAEVGKLPPELSRHRREAYLASKSLDVEDVFRQVEATLRGRHVTQAQRKISDATGTKPAQVDSEPLAATASSGLDRSEDMRTIREKTRPDQD